MDEPIRLNENDKATLGEIKADIVADVKIELDKLGYQEIPSSYDGGLEISKLVNEAHKLRAEYEEKVTAIKDRYAEKVAKEKITVLEQDLRYDLEGLASEIDDINAKDEKSRLGAIEDFQKDVEYVADRKDAIGMLSLLKDVDIPYDMFIGMINCMVEAKDEKYLKIAKLLVGKSSTNTYIVDQALNNIKNYKENYHLKNFSDVAREYILRGKDPVSLYGYMMQYKEEK